MTSPFTFTHSISCTVKACCERNRLANSTCELFKDWNICAALPYAFLLWLPQLSLRTPLSLQVLPDKLLHQIRLGALCGELLLTHVRPHPQAAAVPQGPALRNQQVLSDRRTGSAGDMATARQSPASTQVPLPPRTSGR